MKLNEKFEATLWGVLCVIGATSVVIGGAVWTISRTIQSDELDGYRKAKEWNVKEAIEEITKVSTQAKLDSKDRNELLQLRTQVASHEKTMIELKSDHLSEFNKLNTEHKQIVAEMEAKHMEMKKSFTEKIENLTKLNGELQSALNAIVKESDSIKVAKGEAQFIIPNTIAVGVENTYGNFATVNIGKTSISSMSPADSHMINLGTKTYLVTLMKIDEDSCTFSFSDIRKTN